MDVVVFECQGVSANGITNQFVLKYGSGRWPHPVNKIVLSNDSTYNKTTPENTIIFAMLDKKHTNKDIKQIYDELNYIVEREVPIMRGFTPSKNQDMFNKEIDELKHEDHVFLVEEPLYTKIVPGVYLANPEKNKFIGGERTQDAKQKERISNYVWNHALSMIFDR